MLSDLQDLPLKQTAQLLDLRVTTAFERRRRARRRFDKTFRRMGGGR